AKGMNHFAKHGREERGYSWVTSLTSGTSAPPRVLGEGRPKVPTMALTDTGPAAVWPRTGQVLCAGQVPPEGTCHWRGGAPLSCQRCGTLCSVHLRHPPLASTKA
uniref:Uncharacterized protein n=1 Tax=Strigops habroptila TaxID=2489341 RepID=A0A672UPJ0_STRHB